MICRYYTSIKHIYRTKLQNLGRDTCIIKCLKLNRMLEHSQHWNNISNCVSGSGHGSLNTKLWVTFQ